MKIKLVFVSTAYTCIVLCILNSLTGCLSVKPAATKSGKNLFETFYVGDEGTQYFIKPLILVNTQNREEIAIDFTFRYKNEIKDSVALNLSLQSSNIFKSFDSLSFSNQTHKIVSKELRLLFNEKRNSLYISRFTTKFPLVELNKLFDTNDWALTLYKDNSYTTYISEKQTKKAITKLEEKIFTLF